MSMLAVAGAYLATKPTGAVLWMLWVAVVSFGVAAVVGLVFRTFYATALAIGLLFFALAFLVKG